MEPCKESAKNFPKSSLLLRLSLFSTPIMLAYAVAQAPLSNSLSTLGNQVNLICSVDRDASSGIQAQVERVFFDTSWLPSKGEFETVANNQPEETMWNPLNKNWLSAEQLDLLGMAYAVGYKDGGAGHARLLQAVLLQETMAGQLGRLGHLSAPLGKRSYGVMQVKVAAARDVLRRKPQFGYFASDEQLITRLIADDEFNIHIASAYLKYLRRNTESDHQALVAYNIGISAARRVMDTADDFKYVQNVDRYLDEVVARYNTKFPGRETVRVARM